MKLKKYKRRWDAKNGVFQDAPEHNATSHVADAIGYASQWMSDFITRRDKPMEKSTIKMNRRL